jgi:bifunctional DNA-binding transcriptional regulator/antitoxin component of YhaV-PrlF toxin-antitoxin module
MTTQNQKYEVILQEDENGDLLLPLPEPLLKEMGWGEGTEIEFVTDSNGRIVMRKA